MTTPTPAPEWVTTKHVQVGDLAAAGPEPRKGTPEARQAGQRPTTPASRQHAEHAAKAADNAAKVAQTNADAEEAEASIQAAIARARQPQATDVGGTVIPVNATDRRTFEQMTPAARQVVLNDAHRRWLDAACPTTPAGLSAAWTAALKAAMARTSKRRPTTTTADPTTQEEAPVPAKKQTEPTKAPAKATAAKPAVYLRALEVRKAAGDKRPEGFQPVKLDDDALVAHVVSMRRTHPDLTVNQGLEVAYWMDKLAISKGRWTTAWDTASVRLAGKKAS